MTAHGASREALAAARERLDALMDNTSVDAAKLGAPAGPRIIRMSGDYWVARLKRR